MRTRPATLPAAVCVSAAIGACGQRIGRVEIAEGQVPQGVILPAATAVVADFAPARIEVHPLSRLEGVGDERRAVVQVQVLDAFGHDVKWPGAVSVEVSPNESFAPSRVRWVDITQGEPNARL
ncbi:MAG TPA: hypothetical protein VFF65_06285, partial [Phycisphaerales bacterium]|nr:hypothetical protein [Phycisphaerales bacterium]